MRYIGIDLHSNSFTVCYMEEGKQEVLQTFNLQDELDVFLSSLRSTDEIALEATGNSMFFRDAVLPLVKRVVIVAPHQFKVIRNSVKKTDKHDARAIALFLSKNMLPEARIKDPQHRQLLGLAQTRDQFVKTKVALINRVYGILNGHGLKIKKAQLTTIKGFDKAVALEELSPLEKASIAIIRDELASLRKHIKELEKLLVEYAEHIPGYKNLLSIKGIGPLGAAIFMAHISDIGDFKDPGKLAAYFGITPKVSQSNNKCINGHITKRGSKLARRTLVQCALIAKKYNPYISDFYERVKKRRGPGKAIIAVARKLLNTMFYTLKNDWIFEDFENFKINSCN